MDFLCISSLYMGCWVYLGCIEWEKELKPPDIKSQYVPLPRNISPAGMELNPKVEPFDE